MASPYESSGMRRRAAAQQIKQERILAPQAIATEDPYAGNWAAETARSVAANTVNTVPALQGLARKLAGDNEGANEAFARYGEGEERARALGPKIQSFDDAREAGGGVGDFGASIAYQGASMLPDLAMSITGAGIGATAAKAAATGAARRVATKELTGFARNRGVFDQAKNDAVDAATAAARGPLGQDAARVAARQGVESVEDTIKRQVVMATGRTPRERAATKVGQFAGAAAGQFPGINTANAEILSQEGADQTDAAKALLGTTAASMIGAIPIERFLGRFGGEAAAAAKESAERFLPRVAKEFAKQGLAEGSAEVAQEATQRASHKWIDENIEMLGPEAMDAYLASFAGGFLAGGVLGSTGEAVRGSGAAIGRGASAVKQGAGNLRDSVRENLRKHGDAARAAFDKKRGQFEVGQPIDGAGAEGSASAAGGIGDLYRKAAAAARDLGTKADDATRDLRGKAGEQIKSASDRLRSVYDGLQSDEDLNARADAVMDMADEMRRVYDEGGEPFAPIQSRRGHVRMETPLQTMLASSIPDDNPVWQDRAALRSTMASFERVIRGEGSEADHASVDGLNAAFGPDKLEMLLGMGPSFATAFDERARKAAELDKLPGEEGLDVAEDDSRAVAREDDGELGSEVDVTDWQAGMGETNADKLTPLDEMESIRRSLESGVPYNAAGPQTREELIKRGTELKGQLRDELLGTKDGVRSMHSQDRRLFVRSKGSTTEATLNAMAEFDRREEKAQYVRLAKPIDYALDRANDKRDALLDLGAMVQRQRAKVRADGTTNADIGAQQALLSGFKELAMAGVDVDFSTLSPGLVYSQVFSHVDKKTKKNVYKDADTPIFRLTPNDVKALKEGKGGTLQRMDGQRTTTVDGRMASEEPGIATGDELDLAGNEKHVLKPRAAPPSRMMGNRQVPDMGGIADADATDPYASVIESARHRIAPMTVKADRDRVIFDAGLEVGMAELDRLRPSMTERRYNQAIAKLEDPASGEARRYFRQAVRGKFVTASAKEINADQALAHGSDGKYATRAVQGKEGGEMLTRQADWPDPKAAPTPRNRKRWEQLGKSQQRIGAMKSSAWRTEKLTEIEKEKADILQAERARKLAATKPTPEARTTDTVVAARSPGTDGAAPVTAKVDNRAAASARRASAIKKRKRREAVIAEKNARRDVQLAALPQSKRKLNAEAKDATDERSYEEKQSDARLDAKLDAIFRNKEDGVQFDDGVTAAAATKPDSHDYNAESGLANAILGALGFDYRVKVSGVGGKRGTSGGIWVHKNQVVIGKSLVGKERIEVLAHEVGHAVVGAHIGKLLGVDPTTLRNADGSLLRGDQWMDKLAEVDPKLHAELTVDYDKWMAGIDFNSLDTEIRASRAGKHRGEGLLARNHGLPLTELDGDAQVDLLSMNEWLADNIARALVSKPEGQTLIGKFFADLAAQLREVYDAFTGAGSAPAPSVDVWIKSLFDQNKAAVSQVAGHSVPQAVAEASVASSVLNAMHDQPALPFRPDDFASMISFVRHVMNPETRRILNNVLDRGPMRRALRAQFEGNADALRAMDDAATGMETRIAYAYGMWLGGGLKVGPQGTSAMHKAQDDLVAIFGLAGQGEYAQRIFTDIASGRVATMGKKYDVVAAEARARGQGQKVFDQMNRLYDKVAEPMSKVFAGKMQRLFDTGIPAMRELAARIQRPQGATGEDKGYTPAVRETTHKMLRKAAAVLQNLEPKDRVTAMDMLQRQMTDKHPKWATKSEAARKAVAQMRAQMDAAYDYAKDAGIDVGKRENYFPVVFDLNNPRARDTLTKLYSQPHFDEAIRKFYGKKDAPSKAPIEELIKNLVDGALGAELQMADRPGVAPKDGPVFHGGNYRVSQFVYELGSEADVKAFASVQSKDSPDVLARYIEPLVKRAEATRRGLVGEGKDQLFLTMTQQGATPAQIAEANDILKAALGTYGADGSPVLRMISPDLANKFGGEKTRAFVQGGQAYQNARLLPLSLLASLVDPMGIAVRNGGDFSTAWDGFKLGMNTIWNKAKREEMQAALSLLGGTEDLVPALMMGQGFDGQPNLTAQKVNDFVFKYNGMKGWVQATRYMALHTAHGFMLKHANRSNETSNRYLDELGLRPGDIHSEVLQRPDGSSKTQVKLLTEAQREKVNADERARDDRVRSALMQFTDEAILRPNSQQTPLWHSDPYMGLVTQYKSFTYAIFDQIGGRISREVQHGNLQVLVPMLAYIPVVIMAEMLRGLIQYGMEGNKFRKDFTATDYVMLGADRSGLFIGPGKRAIVDTISDAQRGRVPGSSQLGPTAGQAREVVTSRNYGKTFEGALPASAAWKRWNDGDGTATGGATRRGADLPERQMAEG